MYSIYKITSPSGRSYIGLTKTPVKERWAQHVKRAKTDGKNHPFYNAIRKYGKSAFTVETIDTASDKQAAQSLEQKHIANAPKGTLYNVSPGGEADGETGAAVFWGRMDNDPEARAAYTAKLKARKNENDWTDYEKLLAGSIAWRKANPREASRIQRKGLRAARKIKGAKAPDTRPLKEKLMWKHKRGVKTREITTATWANRTQEQIAELANKIGEKAKARWVEITDPAERSKRTAVARSKIDRSKQGPAASAGIKRFWAELKSDPVRYAEYIAARKATLKKTLVEQGKCVRTTS